MAVATGRRSPEPEDLTDYADTLSQRQLRALNFRQSPHWPPSLTEKPPLQSRARRGPRLGIGRRLLTVARPNLFSD